MPEIPLFSEQNYVASIVLPIMWAPKDLDSVNSFLALVKGSSDPSKLLLKTIKDFARATIGGQIAGEVFLTLLQWKTHRSQDASVGKAVFLVSSELKDRARGGQKITSNRDRVHSFWAQYRPAAHLWAAFQILEYAGRMRRNISAEEKVALCNDILMCADGLLSRAAAAKMKFDPDPWTLPDAYPRKHFPLNIPPPSSWAIKRLKEYRAPKPI